MDVHPTGKEGANLGHSARFLAAMQRRESEIKKKRKREEEDREQKEEEERCISKKKMKTLASRAQALSVEVEKTWRKGMKAATKAQFQYLYGGEWEWRMAAELEASR